MDKIEIKSILIDFFLHCCYQMVVLQLESLGPSVESCPPNPMGLHSTLPPGALEEDKEISLQVLTEIPNGLTLTEDELLVSHGFQCYPSGLCFKKPAKLIIPHCALVTVPNNVKTILYSWNQSGN